MEYDHTSFGLDNPDNLTVSIVDMTSLCNVRFTHDTTAEFGLRGDVAYWNVGEQEVLRIEPDGSVYVRGERVDDNPAIYAALRGFIETTMGPR